jgi:predicted NBD/HSP70 family sugar kinase
MHLVVGEAGLEPSQILGVGMALAGPLDRATGRPNPSSISPSWVGLDAAREMRRHVGHIVHIDNDANLGALAESMWGAGRGATDAAYVKIDTGVGAALILGGQLYRGAVGTAGEIGHSTIAEDGPVCRCGNRGCLERFVGTPALLESLRGSHGDLSVHDLLRLAAAVVTILVGVLIDDSFRSDFRAERPLVGSFSCRPSPPEAGPHPRPPIQGGH